MQRKENGRSLPNGLSTEERCSPICWNILGEYSGAFFDSFLSSVVFFSSFGLSLLEEEAENEVLKEQPPGAEAVPNEPQQPPLPLKKWVWKQKTQTVPNF